MTETPRTFRNFAAFGKRIEYWIIGRVLKEARPERTPGSVVFGLTGSAKTVKQAKLKNIAYLSGKVFGYGL